MTIFRFYVSPPIPNIEKFEVYGGLWTPGGISSFFSFNFPSNGVRIMSGDLFLTRVMTIFINVTILEGVIGECIWLPSGDSPDPSKVLIFMIFDSF